ncbi:hypothetical protein [Sedimenticola sp.]|uniref:hypothetical protein n=1 Tax=Sedimenticola sp. TaxID=1940285 RepID=UPI003D1061B6
MAFLSVIGSAIGWLSTALGGLVGALVSLVGYQVAAFQVAEAVARATRITLVIVCVMGVVNALIPPGTNLYTLWSGYAAGSSFLAWIGYFVPIGLLFTLMDLMLFAATTMLIFKAIKWANEASK